MLLINMGPGCKHIFIIIVKKCLENVPKKSTVKMILGGVIIIGGTSTGDDYLDTIYRLAHAAAQWEQMPQKLKIKKRSFVAFLIHEEFTNCTLY
jgi:hypothetical protein